MRVIDKGNSIFSSFKEYSTGDIPTSTAINDYNNDGYVDIAIANEGGNSITLYQNSATSVGNFDNRKDYKIGDWPRDITGGDFNGDGWLDLATVTSNDDKIWINLNEKKNTISYSAAINFSTERSPVGLWIFRLPCRGVL